MSKSSCAVLVLLLTFYLPPVQAGPADFALFQWIFNVDGVIYDSAGIAGSSTLPAKFGVVSGSPLAPIDPATGGGLGVLSVEITGTGSHNFVAYFDQEIRQTLNGFSNESAFAVGAAPAGLTYQAGDPFASPGIYDDVLAGALTSSVEAGPNDVALALGWNFILADGEKATVFLTLSETAPQAGFHLQQSDPDSTGSGTGARNLYYSSSLSITSTPQGEIPEPGYFAVLAAGLSCIALAARRRRRTTPGSSS